MLHCPVCSMHSRTTSCNRADRAVGCTDRAWQKIPARRDQVGQWALPFFFFFLFFLYFPIQHRRITDHSRVPPLALPGQTALVAFRSSPRPLCPNNQAISCYLFPSADISKNKYIVRAGSSSSSRQAQQKVDPHREGIPCCCREVC